MPELTPYYEYLPTEIPWMGRVPTHWEILSLGQVGTLTKGTGGNKEDELPTGMPCVRYGDLYTTHKYFVENARSFIAPEVADQYTKIKFGDVLFAASGETADEIGKSAVNLLRGPAYCGGDVILFRPHGHLIPRYTGYMMDCEPIVHQKATMGRGFTVYHIYGKQLKYLRIPIPPPEEQAAIVRFLDHADEQIQRYIAGKERLITLLEEQRQALVHQAVTRGLDPNVRLKPSGVEWLGDVPEHWELRRIRSLAAIGTGDKDTINRDVEGTYPFFVRSQNVERIDTWSFDGEAVLTAGDGAGVGKVFHYFNGKFDFHQRVYKFSDFKDILGKFFYYSLKASLPYLTQQGTAKSTVDSLRLPMLQNIKTTVPPSEEQEELTRYLEQAEHRIDYAVAQAHRQIDLMTEYRTQLIADVVTGQLDVRKAAAQLPAAP